jgi:hypothetical protein
MSPAFTSSGSRLPSSLGLKARREHLALLWLFLCGIRNDDRARVPSGFLKPLNDETVVERSDIHGCAFQTTCVGRIGSNLRFP